MIGSTRFAIRGVFLALLVAAVTACGGSDGSPSQVSVPNVIGDTQAAATTAITGASLTLGTITQASSGSVASGDVISETPAAGASVASGSAVALVVSTGPASVAVPNVVGDTQAAASTAITGAGLTVGAVTQSSSATVASGEVISENPAAGASVAGGSAVALVVSSGPQTQTIGGAVIGLTSGATVHVMNGADDVAISANGPFTFPTGLPSGATYSVTVGTPSSAQACGVLKASGTVASANITNITVYCTFNVSNSTLNKAYGEVLADFHVQSSGSYGITDYAGTDTYDGAGNLSLTATLNYNGTIDPGFQSTGTYAVSTLNAIASVDGAGGIEGVNASAVVGTTMVSGVTPFIYVDLLPNSSATTASVSGNYTQVFISAAVSTGVISAGEGPLTLANGTISGTYTANSGGTISTGNTNSGSYTVSNGAFTTADGSSGTVSADGNLVTLGDTVSGDDPQINVALRRGSGVTQATVEGIYSVVQYGGTPVASTFSKAITLTAYGDGTYDISFSKNANGTISTNNADTGTYTVTSDGTLTLMDSEGDVFNGAISADGNALILGSVAAQQNPSIFVGVRL